MVRRTASSDIFLAIADPTRRALLDRLRAGERSVSDLAGMFDMSQPAVSQHLRILREAGLVRQRPDGRRRVYTLRPDPLRQVAKWVNAYERFWRKKLRQLGDFLEENK
jgi:DNA-binding transcriptional ArsR family regulator